MAADTIRLAAGDAVLSLLPSVGGRASSLVIAGVELFGRNNDEDVSWGCFPMVPWQGRLTDNSVTWDGVSYEMPKTFQQWALHGLGYLAPWSVQDVSETSAVLELELGRDDDPWPWPCTVRAGWRLEPDRLETNLEVVSEAVEFPVELGWHPWFPRTLPGSGPVELDPPPGRMFVRGPDDLLTGDLVEPTGGPYDDAFELSDGTIGLNWPKVLQLTVQTDCRYAVVYDHLPHVVCLEPQTAPPDWINRKPAVASPGHPRSARATWSWSLHS
jgi:aldose 1-epimerase